MNVPMLYVNPVTGVHAGRRWLCYVCLFGSAPVLAVFVRREEVLNARVIEAAQKLDDKYTKLHTFVVCLSGPDEALEENIRKMAEQQKITIPIAVLPEQNSVESIYKALPIKRESIATVLLYRGRQVEVENVFHDLHFEDAVTSPPSDDLLRESSSLGTPAGGLRTLDALTIGPFTARKVAVEHSTNFRKLDAAAAALVQG